MDGRRARIKKHIFLYHANLLAILLALFGCAATPGVERVLEARNYLDNSDKLMIKGDYADALKEAGEALKRCPNSPPGDRALYQMGLIWAHPKNLERDSERSIGCFQMLLTKFPDSGLTGKAGMHIDTIVELNNKDKEIRDLKKSVDWLVKRLGNCNRAASRQRKEINVQTGIIGDLKKTVAGLKDKLITLKRIDFTIEEKRRKHLSVE